MPLGQAKIHITKNGGKLCINALPTTANLMPPLVRNALYMGIRTNTRRRCPYLLARRDAGY